MREGIESLCIRSRSEECNIIREKMTTSRSEWMVHVHHLRFVRVRDDECMHFITLACVACHHRIRYINNVPERGAA